MKFITNYSLGSNIWNQRGVGTASAHKTEKITADKMLSHPNTSLDMVEKAWSQDSDHTVKRVVRDNIFIECQYEHYIKQQNKQAKSLNENDWETIDISSVDLVVLRKMLSNEDFERLKESKPQTLNAAKRAGIKQAALMLIYN